jgi:ABC-type transporter Mla subunit MlaD
MRLPLVLDPREIAALGPRLVRLVGGVERLLADARELLARVEHTRAEADDVVHGLRATAARLDTMVTLVEPPVVRLVPSLESLGDQVGPDEVASLVAAVRNLPGLEEATRGEVLPALAGMSGVASDLHDLLLASRELNELLGNVPGMGRAKKKVEEAREEDPS